MENRGTIIAFLLTFLTFLFTLIFFSNRESIVYDCFYYNITDCRGNNSSSNSTEWVIVEDIPGLEKMLLPNVVWSFCNRCKRLYVNENLLLCATCGKNFCPFCDSMSQYSTLEELLHREEDVMETFCSLLCKRAYKGSIRRTGPASCTRSRSAMRRRPSFFYDSSDDSDGSTSPIGRWAWLIGKRGLTYFFHSEQYK